MLEFTSLKVSSADSADLATQLTSMSAQGWVVVNIVSIGNDIVAYLSRPVASTTSETTPAAETSGWAATNALTPIATSPTPSSFVTPTPASTQNVVATPSPAPSVPADWYKDPASRFEYRYWDGTKWTENVSRGGVMYKDPPTK